MPGVLHVEHGGRLVHNQHARAIHQRLENFHKLLIGHRHVFYGLKRIDVDAIALHDLAHALFHFLKGHKPAEFRDLLADEYIFDGVHGGNQVIFLVDDFDAQFGGERRRKGVVSLAVNHN